MCVLGGSSSDRRQYMHIWSRSMGRTRQWKIKELLLLIYTCRVVWRRYIATLERVE